MTTKKKTNEKANENRQDPDDFTSELIKQINKEHNASIAFNLKTDDAPTNIKRWISTGSRQLDCIVSNKKRGGFAEGRIVEISGPSSSGKSHIASLVAKSTQEMGGIVVYIDTENATSLENLEILGVDTGNRFVFVQTGCTEEVFQVAESAIMKARAMTKDVPVTIIWDSVAATSPKAELEGDYDQNTIGLQARVIGKGMRKITNIIANQNVLFLLINQQRKVIGVSYGDDTTTPGGMAIPYSCSTRVRITSTGQSLIKDKEGNVIGIKVKAKTIKNKVARPFRSVEFTILYGKGVVEHEETFDVFKQACDKHGPALTEDGKHVLVEGNGTWKTITISNAKTGEVIEEIKTYKADFGNKFLYVPKYEKEIDALFEHAFVASADTVESHHTYDGVDEDSFQETQSILIDRAEQELRSEGKI